MNYAKSFFSLNSYKPFIFFNFDYFTWSIFAPLSSVLILACCALACPWKVVTLCTNDNYSAIVSTAVARTYVNRGGGGGVIHIFMFCPTSFF